jgi:hypothetical protein
VKARPAEQHGDHAATLELECARQVWGAPAPYGYD